MLADDTNADEVTKCHIEYQMKHPFPNRWEDIAHAIHQGRELAGRSGIPFGDSDGIFTECQRVFDRIRNILIVPQNARQNIGGSLLGPLPLNEIWLREMLGCQALFDRLSAFEIHAKSRGFLSPDANLIDEGAQRRFKERDDEVIRLKNEYPNLSHGQIAKRIISTCPEWATMENGKALSAGAVRAILSRARKSGLSP